MRYIKLLLLATLLLVTALIGQSVSAHEDGSPIIVHMTKTGFVPKETDIEQGEQVIFVNDDTVDHWPASDIHPTHNIYPEFDPKRGIAPAETWGFTFLRIGTWGMHDHLYPQFTGSIVVKPSDATTTATSTATSTNPRDGQIQESFFGKLHFSLTKIFYKIFPTKLKSDFDALKLKETTDDEKLMSYWLKLEGGKAMMEKLLDESGNSTKFDCHQRAHQIGRTAYKTFGAGAFADGTGDCHSGFYHGAMEAMLYDKGTDNLATTVEDLCNSFKNQFGIFECYHGIGHGVMAYRNYDLPKALDTCKQLSGGWEQASCDGGVFMENVIVEWGGGVDLDHKTNWLSQDPLFPCNAPQITDSMAISQCYGMQTSRMLQLTNFDYKKIGQLCSTVQMPFALDCFRSLGRDISGQFNRNPQKIAEKCALVPQPTHNPDQGYYDLCIEGAVNVIVDFFGDKYTNQADPVCVLVPKEHQEYCKNILTKRMNDFKPKATAMAN